MAERVRYDVLLALIYPQLVGRFRQRLKLNLTGARVWRARRQLQLASSARSIISPNPIHGLQIGSSAGDLPVDWIGEGSPCVMPDASSGTELDHLHIR